MMHEARLDKNEGSAYCLFQNSYRPSDVILRRKTNKIKDSDWVIKFVNFSMWNLFEEDG